MSFGGVRSRCGNIWIVYIVPGPRLIPIEVPSQCGRIDPQKVTHVRSQCGRIPWKFAPCTIPATDELHLSEPMSEQVCGRIVDPTLPFGPKFNILLNDYLIP